LTSETFELTPEDSIAIRAAIAEVDLQQAEIDCRLTPAQRVRKAMSLSKMMRRIAIYRLRQENPELSEAEAQRIFLERYYSAE
jgi:hypothetical protein